VLVALTAWGVLAGSASVVRRSELTWARSGSDGAATFRLLESSVPYGSTVWTTRFLAPEKGDPPVPPGLTRFPADGRVWLSPALAQVLQAHPEVRSRLPGQIAGVIGDGGLESPDELLAIVGRARGGVPGGFVASGWGAPFSATTRPTVPQDGLLVITAALVGVPLVSFALVVARMSAGTRRRRAAALHLMGVPVRTLRRAAATESAVLGGAGALLGTGVAGSLLPWLAGSGLAGIAWFGTETGLGLGRAAVVTGVLVLLLATAASLATRRSLANVTMARHHDRPPRGVLRYVPGVVGLGVLAGFVIVGVRAPGSADLASGPFAVLAVAAMLAATTGALLALSPVLAAAGRAVRAVVSAPGLLLAARRLEMDAAGTARSALGIVLLFTTGLLGAGALADVEAQNRSRPQGHLITVVLSDAYGAPASRAVTEIPARAVVLDTHARAPGTGTPKWVGTCSALVVFASTAGSDEAQALQRECVDNDQVWVSAMPGSTPEPGVRSSFVPGLLGRSDVLGEGQVFRTLPPAHAVAQVRHATVYALVGPGDAPAEQYVTRVLQADPQALVSYGELTTLAGQTPLLRRLTLSSLVLGMLVAVGAFLLAAHDRQQERQRETAALVIIGVPHRVRAQATATVQVTAAVVACVIGAVVGAASALAYLSMAGDDLRIADLQGRLALLAGVALGLTLVAVAVEAVFSDRTLDPELLHRA
jgi:hypothetical protein